MQLVIIIYSISSVIAKFASGQDSLSMGFMLFYAAEIAVLGIYAILWQQMIKKFDLSIAYANRAMVLLWSMVWAVLIFHDQITIQNVFGIILVIIGTVIVNGDNKAEEEAAHVE